jgi:HD superfamily phosphodiesterase
MPISEEVLERIQLYSIHMDWERAFGGKSRGNRHLFRVNKLARHLQEAEGGDLDIIMAGAWLHDIGLVEGNDGHCFKGVPIARKFLERFKVDEETIARIIHCIEAHDGEVEANTVEAKIIHDADTIDKMGPLGAIRHAWKMANLEGKHYTALEILEMLPEHLAERQGRLYFATSRKLVEKYHKAMSDFFGDREMARNMIHHVIEEARSGIPSDVLIHRIQEDESLPDDFRGALAEQSSISLLQEL